MVFYEKFLKLKTALINLYNKNKKVFVLTVIIIFLVIFVLTFPTKTYNNKKNYEVDNEQILISNSYKNEVETKIKRMISKLSNITFIDVMVVVESSEINKWQTEKETTKTTGSAGETIIEKENIVFEKNGSNQKPILVSILYPKILSVLIVVNNIDASTKISIKNSIAGVLNLSEESIFILQDR